jgi:quercetin dioxygenase-like cupin family protein
MASIMKVKGNEAETGPRGEFQHVSGDRYSLNFWKLRQMARSEAHANPYDLAIYIISGQLSVFDEKGVEIVIEAGDSVLVPAHVIYSMSTDAADAVESRVHPAG